jgi:hypothetical protein
LTACKTARDLAGGRPSDPVPVVGEAPTVGNSPDGSVGEIPVPEIGGTVPGAAGRVTSGLVGLVVGATWTRSVAERANEVAPVADAFAVSRT